MSKRTYLGTTSYEPFFNLETPPISDTYCTGAQETIVLKDSGQTQGTTAIDVADMTIPIKGGGAKYVLEYRLVYSTSGLLVGAQFALDFTGGVSAITYSLMMSNADDSVVNAVTSVLGTFVGSGAALAGGGPKFAYLIGRVTTGVDGGDLRLRMKATGIGTSMTLQAGSMGVAKEI